MERRDKFLTFLTALVPGVGYMYLGLLRRGIEMFILFWLSGRLFGILGIGFLSVIIQAPIWFYAFFDTFSVALRLGRGETVQDTGFIFNKVSDGSNNIVDNNKIGKSFNIIIAVGLIAVGTLAIINTALKEFTLYSLVRSYISMLFIPVIFILGGIYLLIRNKA